MANILNLFPDTLRRNAEKVNPKGRKNTRLTTTTESVKMNVPNNPRDHGPAQSENSDMKTHHIAHFIGIAASVWAAGAVAHQGFDASGVSMAGFNAIVAIGAIGLLPFAIRVFRSTFWGGVMVSVFWLAALAIQLTQTFDVIATNKANAAIEIQRQQDAHDKAEATWAEVTAARAGLVFRRTTAEDVTEAEAIANRAQIAAQRADEATQAAKAAADQECEDGLGPRCERRRVAEAEARASAAEFWGKAGEAENAARETRVQKGLTDQAAELDAAVTAAKAALEQHSAPDSVDAQSAKIAASTGYDQETVSAAMDFMKSFGVEIVAIAFLVVAAFTAPTQAEIAAEAARRRREEKTDATPPKSPTKRELDAQNRKEAKAKKEESAKKAAANAKNKALNDAAAAIRNGMSKAAACRAFGISVGSLYRHLEKNTADNVVKMPARK